jgi:hypothetical protein
VVTVGEKIGKEHLTYAQGACAELVAMATISAADNYGLPVSTTHVLSSGVAGTMAASKSGAAALHDPQYRYGVDLHAAGRGAAFRRVILPVPAVHGIRSGRPISRHHTRAPGSGRAFFAAQRSRALEEGQMERNQSKRVFTFGCERWLFLEEKATWLTCFRDKSTLVPL